MNTIIDALKNLTGLDSNATLELFNAFEKEFNSEKNIIDLLYNYFFSENKVSESVVIKALENLKNRRD